MTKAVFNLTRSTLLRFSRYARLLFVAAIASCCLAEENDLQPLYYNDPNLTVDLAVGLWAWPLPMDFDQDGDMDLVVSCPDKPYNGIYFFENPDGRKFPTFLAAKKISRGVGNVRVSHVNGQTRVLTPGQEYPQFLRSGVEVATSLPVNPNFHKLVGTRSTKIRANQWTYVDFDADDDLDLIVGIGDWSDYGWDNAFDSNGNWTHGPLHGFVYLIKNNGSDSVPKFTTPEKINANGETIDVFGWPSPNFADFDGDGDLDLICGEFLDGFTYFQNVGTKQQPNFSVGIRLTSDGKPLRMDLQMIVPVSIDWDADGDVDLIVGDEDGRVALVEHTGRVRDGIPEFNPPRYFQQQADLLKCGALSTPFAFDWDADGDQDIVSGNTAGYIEFFENRGKVDGNKIRWAAPEKLQADGETIRIQAGTNGSIQGPCEAKWGYTTVSIADWNHDGLPDVLANSIWGKVVWFQNVGTMGSAKLDVARPIQVEWASTPPRPAWNWWDPKGNELATQWRTTPVVADLNQDGLNDLVMLDHEGFLTFFERTKRDSKILLLPGERIFVDESGQPIWLNERIAGGSGRRKLCVVDWDADGDLDLLTNSKNADLYRNIGTKDGHIVLKHEGSLADRLISSHTTSPTVIDLDENQTPDLLIGAEDGHFYYQAR